MKYRIGINGYFLSRPFTGFGVYTKGYLNSLPKVLDRDKFKIVVFTPVKPKEKLNPLLELVVVPQRSRFGTSWDKLIWEQAAINKAAAVGKVDLLHHMYPATIIKPKGFKQLTSLHDATPWHFAEHNLGLKVNLYRRFVVWSNRKADHFVSVSQYGRDDVSSVYSIPKQKIDVVYNGIDGSFRSTVTAAGKKRIRRKYRLDNNFIFYIGGFEVHKNVRRLFLAYAAAASKISHDLVIAGGVFSKTRLQVYRDFYDLPGLIAEHKLGKRVKMIGVVPNRDLPALYQSADLFVMPSLAEGFNLPLAQALASRTPAIAADTLISREVAGSAAKLVDGTDISAMEAAIVQVLKDKKTREEMVAKGVDRQKGFTWENAARRMAGIYEKMLADRR